MSLAQFRKITKGNWEVPPQSQRKKNDGCQEEANEVSEENENGDGGIQNGGAPLG